jgi:hypothetical protein
MSSNLPQIITSLAGMTVSGYPMTVYHGSGLKNSIEVADLPARVINTIGIQSNRTRTKTLGGAGHVMQTVWTITDVALLRPAAMGIGLSDIAEDMTEYMANYHQSLRSVVGSGWVIVDTSVRGQVLEWPQSSGRFYDAVAATITFSEFIQ